MRSPRVWLITGAATGFGRLLTELVLENGEIAIATARKLEALQDLHGKYSSDQLLLLKCDVTKKEDVPSVFKDAIAKFGRVDVVLNNAGTAVLAEVEVQEQEDTARWMFEVNFWGAGRVAAESVRVFRDENPAGAGGLLLNVSSGLGQFGWAAGGYYTASKHALEGLVESLTSLIELGPFNTRMGKYSATPSFPIHPAYNNPESITYQAHQMIGKGSPLQGDATKAAKRIYELSQLDEVPLYFPLSSLVVYGLQEKMKTVSESIVKFASWSEGLEIEA
ncbi:hypothetical protein ONZ45_g8447 [Pleurotus djamor]|nr:hypothetical protein ONZ45_g8447 [Pleurotus djamor]